MLDVMRTIDPGDLPSDITRSLCEASLMVETIGSSLTEGQTIHVRTRRPALFHHELIALMDCPLFARVQSGGDGCFTIVFYQDSEVALAGRLRIAHGLREKVLRRSAGSIAELDDPGRT